MAAFFLLGPVSTYKFNMSQATPTLSSLSSSRLVSLLTEMTSAKVTVSGRHFSEKLGSFLDMSDSITLSEAHASLSRLSYEPLLTEVADIQDVFLHARRDMVASVTRSFSPGSSPLGIKLPIRENNNLADKPLSFSPYHRFYAAHQRDLDIKVSSLHCQIRDMVAGISPAWRSCRYWIRFLQRHLYREPASFLTPSQDYWECILKTLHKRKAKVQTPGLISFVEI